MSKLLDSFFIAIAILSILILSFSLFNYLGLLNIVIGVVVILCCILGVTLIVYSFLEE